MEAINSFDILISLIKACQDDFEEPRVYGPDVYRNAALGGVFYLLNQSIRYLRNRNGHKCASENALELRDKLKVGDSIFNYSNQKLVYYKNEMPVHIKGYVGAKSTPEREKDIKFNNERDCFRFRQVFHIEHIVPINIILKQLINIDLTMRKEEVYKKIDDILDKIYICYMTKEEDRKLNKLAKTKRPDNYADVINTIYKEAGIKIATWM